MRWIIQENLNSIENYINVIYALENQNTEFIIVTIKNNKMLILDKETKIPLDNSDYLISEFVKSGSIMVYGSKALANIAKEMNLKPGSFLNSNFEFELLKDKFGDNLLNSELIIDNLYNLNPPWNEFFIRPTGNTKLFTGFKTNLSDFYVWKENVLNSNKYTGEDIMISPIQNILSEYRFFIVKNEIVAASSYIIDGQFNINGEVSSSMINYVKNMINIFSISDAYVIDIANTKEEFKKIIEFNNINTSGLYNSNAEDIVKALNKSF